MHWNQRERLDKLVVVLGCLTSSLSIRDVSICYGWAHRSPIMTFDELRMHIKPTGVRQNLVCVAVFSSQKWMFHSSIHDWKVHL